MSERQRVAKQVVMENSEGASSGELGMRTRGKERKLERERWWEEEGRSSTAERTWCEVGKQKQKARLETGREKRKGEGE
eukprot:2819392-Pleurochrysis_carterae.AAC.1